jgi:serine/threonine-protein kinase
MERLGRYEIIAELGHGAMGTVYRARDPKIDRVVALKTITVAGISPADEEEYRQRFFREAQAAGKLSHGGLVTIFDVGEDEKSKTPFIVMEFIEGKTLEELGRGERLPTATALGLVKQIAEALDYAHGRRIIHRDIKPANIIVTADGRAKITDFGIAKLAQTQFTQPGQVLGTPAYMAPEQLSGGAVDGRSDLFSLGVILYWLLTGDKPFAGDTTTAVSFKIVYQEPIPATQINPSLSPEFDYVLSRALAKDAAGRYQRGQELAEDLEDLFDGRPPRSQATAPAAAEVEHTLVAGRRATPPPAPAATVKRKKVKAAPAAVAAAPERKRRWLIPAAAAAFLLLLGAGAWLWLGKSKSEQAGEPSAQEAGAAVDTTTKPEPAPKPPSAAPAKKTTPVSSKPRQAEERTRATGMATLRLTGEHNFDRATLYVSVDDRVVQEIRLRGETSTRSGATVGFGKISASIPVRPGQRAIIIRISAPKDDFDETEYISTTFEAGRSRTLEVSLGKLGKWVGIGSLTRDLTLRWLD